jgi:hypothetical protein
MTMHFPAGNSRVDKQFHTPFNNSNIDPTLRRRVEPLVESLPPAAATTTENIGEENEEVESESGSSASDADNSKLAFVVVDAPLSLH